MPRKSGAGVTFTIAGQKELTKALRGLPVKVQKNVIRQAMRAGMKLVQEEAKRVAPVGETGDLKSAIKIRAGKTRRGSIAIEVRVGEGDFKGDQYYAAFLEYGTSRMPAKPFLRPALDQAGPKARAVAMEKLLSGVEREASKSAK
jgi:HK97 gp10 family phage protein